ncbi:MAG: hypothetical protein LBU51_04895 [Bacteroidales bacterium]|jgi:hypothetical protein|nr:hypothetical protein [Bacteroidales bacterium]
MSIVNKIKQNLLGEKEEKWYANKRSFVPVGTKHKDGRYVSEDEVRNVIVEFLSPLLEKHGFQYQKSKKAFVRKTQTGCDEIGIGSYDYLHYEFDFAFSKRIDGMQKIITAINFECGFNFINNYKEHTTIYVCYKNLTKKRIEAISYSVLKKELEKLLPLIENEVLPYFEKLNSLEFLNQTINYPEKDPKNIFSYFSIIKNSNRCINALIIAKTLNDPNYETLLKTYMEENPEDLISKGQLIKLDKYLKEHDI